MAPQVKKPKTAFLYYQAEKLSEIRKELGLDMGGSMTELAGRWRMLADDERQKYLDLEQQDRERFEEESAQADAERLAVQEARRRALTVQEGENVRSRGARQKLDVEREQREVEKKERKARLSSSMDPEEVAERKRLREQKKQEMEERQKKRAAEEKQLNKQHSKLDKEQARKAASRLDYLFKQSPIFAKLKLGTGSMEDKEEDIEKKLKEKEEAEKKKGARSRNGRFLSKHELSKAGDAKSGEEDGDGESESDGDEDKPRHIFLTKQPKCIEFGQLKPYQLESLNWMIHLAEKGINGILADEMGLGKTLQSISILAYHYEFLKIQGPHLICVPKSTLSNWMNELRRWCPSLRVIKFHGTREEREAMIEEHFNVNAAMHDGKRPERQIMNEKGNLVDDNSDNPRSWDVCVTTYEVCNAERKALSKFTWKYLIIDEAHRLKNDASMFSNTVRSFRTANRLLLTGTPLQNNLRELWALLNFLLPDIFSSAEQFDEWFDLDIDDEDAKKNMISQLHKILRPFMLRRLKVDVAKGLPPKTETIIMVGMSRMQRQLYKKLLLRDLDNIAGPNSGKQRTAVLNIVMQLRKCCGHPYLFEGVEDRTLDPLGEHLVDNCGKLSMVDKLLKKLKERGSRVLIFTQMTRVLDILEDYLVMRGYQYCRIDGNTNYDDRENAIDSFNAPNSEKFCFILSTRAGGLGINLQTADVCILYDSDWNPQQDLQAQDRCHRLGQKKPVSVYRLVSENTVEEKIVERAQQKLKLDAMVVQQGRLKEKDKVSKEEIMTAVRFGADTIFRSEESTITDDDIDIILARGAAKTKELAEKIQKAEKGDLLDFRLDGGVSAQTFEGIDYSDKELRDQLRLLAADSMGKRERKAPPTGYNPIMHPKKSMIVDNQKIKLPRNLRLPQMEAHQFYNRERLLELGRLEFETYATLRKAGKLPPRDVLDKARTLLPEEIGREKIDLLNEGFGDWTRTQYFNFIKAAAKFGRDDISGIAAYLDMSIEEVAPYSRAFWNYGPTELKDEWEKNISTIERGEKKIAKQKKLTSLLSKFVSTFDDPREEMTFANKGTTHFALEQDRALLCAVEKNGYGTWEAVREDILNDERLQFQHTVQGMTTYMIAKRCDYRMRQMEREVEIRQKTLNNKIPPNVLAARKSIEAIKAMEAWETEARVFELRGEKPPPLNTIDTDAAQNLSERLAEREQCIARLREIEVQVNCCKTVAEETREAILRGDQYVNYSSITLKAGGPVPPSAVVSSSDGRSVTCSGSEIEARVNPEVLSVPECGRCKNCIEQSMTRKLCERRLAVRKRLIRENRVPAKEVEKAVPEEAKSKPISVPSVKKRKAEPESAESNSVASKKVKASPPSDAASVKAAPKKPVASSKNRITSQGNKRMCVPDELLPEFCRRIGAKGTGERMKLINDFAEEHPDVSIRQATIRLSEITTKTLPVCVTPPEKKASRFMFYLRPMYYKYLPPDERPDNWEQFAQEDELLWEKEQAEKARKRKEKAAKAAANKASKSNGSVKSDTKDEETMDGNNSMMTSGSALGDEASNDGEATEDEGEPVLKKPKKS